ncbi:pumilio 5-like [Dorcoceras hygrometricum]|uniref:Pumilio 5-like n=1 Tax=Dorcoceras hygrometricum TaxID=472368 RepID=A0A2Z7CPK1_9LAMI|nr:pumilio 5-like [Dorcoceras hygrometricum]
MEVSTDETDLVGWNSSTVDSEMVPQPFSFVKLDEQVSGHCSVATGDDWNITPNIETTDGSVPGNAKIIPSHGEDPEDDGSSETSASVSVDKAAMCGGHSGSFDSTQVLQSYDSCAASVQRLSLDDDNKAPTALNSYHHKLRKKEQLNPQENTLKQHAALPESNVSPVQGSYSQSVYPGKGHAYGSSNQVPHGSLSLSKAEAQPILETSEFTSPLYAPSTPFMHSQNPCYPNLPPVGFITHQYSVCGYPFNSTVTQSCLAGYPPQGPFPLAFDSASFLFYRPSMGKSLHAYDIQNLEKFYGQVGVSMQPPPADSYHIPYFQPTMQNFYDAFYEVDHQEERVKGVRSRANANDLKKGPGGFQNNLRSQHSAGAGYKNSNIGRKSVSNHSSLGAPTVISHIMQSPSTSFSNPVGLAAHVGEAHFLVERNNTCPHSVYGNSGKIIDQHGSRFIQQKLETCSVEEKTSVFKEVVAHASELMTDVFGNYVIQKLFEYGSQDQKKELANQLESKVLQLSLHVYGCRVIQKAFEVADLEQKVQLAEELDGHVLKCVCDQHGNHVIRKCIEYIPTENIEFIVSSFRGQVVNLSVHPYGCRVIQLNFVLLFVDLKRILEKRDDGLQVQYIVNEILDSVYSLAQDQYGNYVTQQVLKSGIPREKAEIIKKLSGSIVQLSQHKFASSVVEKCLECGDASARDMLIRDIIGNSGRNENILKMMKDQYANYVVQKIMLKCTRRQRDLLLSLIRNHLTTLKRCTYGKHIVARYEQLYGEG